MALPFSYMSFVIRDKLDNPAADMDLPDIFDPEPYHYLFNKSTIFMDSDMCKVNF